MGNFFTDVISNDSRFNSSARISDLALLEPVTRELVRRIVMEAGDLGIDVMVFETYRSQARQQELFLQGATQLQKVGVHLYGLACDIVRVVGGEPSWKGDYSFLGQLAHSAALIWGGDWGNPNVRHTFLDPVHVQRCTVARQGQLFAGAWYPDPAYNPYQEAPNLLFASTTSQKPSRKRARG
jgi:hypothetical protein